MIGMAKGMVATFKHILRPAVTERYPNFKRTLPERSRTMFEMPLGEDGVPACKACMLCAKNCPDGAITIESEKREDGPGRVLTHFSIDLSRCMYCGICVENCPSNALAHTGDYERASSDRADMVLVLHETASGAKTGSTEGGDDA